MSCSLPGDTREVHSGTPERRHEALNVPGKGMGLAGVPGVDFLALLRGLLPLQAVTGHKGTVQDQERQAVADRLFQDFEQIRGLLGDDIQGFGVADVAGGVGYSEAGAELFDVTAVPHPGQDKNGLTVAGELAGALASPELAAVGVQQPGHEEDRVARHAETERNKWSRGVLSVKWSLVRTLHIAGPCVFAFAPQTSRSARHARDACRDHLTDGLWWPR